MQRVGLFGPQGQYALDRVILYPFFPALSPKSLPSFNHNPHSEIRLGRSAMQNIPSGLRDSFEEAESWQRIVFIAD